MNNIFFYFGLIFINKNCIKNIDTIVLNLIKRKKNNKINDLHLINYLKHKYSHRDEHLYLGFVK